MLERYGGRTPTAQELLADDPDELRVAVGKAILDRSSRTDVGTLMLSYGGGGHEAAGTCQVDNDRAASAQQELVGRIVIDG